MLNADADAENDVAQIWIAEGTYIPTKLSDADLNGAVDTDPRSATFSLVDGVSLYGGFAGTESTLDEARTGRRRRLPPRNGPLGRSRPERRRQHRHGEPVDRPTRQDNAYTVVTARDLTQSTTLDGLTITGGNANVSGASSSTPTVLAAGSTTVVRAC